MTKNLEQFAKERENLNNLVMKYASTEIKRFFSLDNQAYQEGAIPSKYKEICGLVGSLVLRCDDCINYHLIQCFNAGVTDSELIEALNIGLVIGGSITIPHLRRAIKSWDEMKN